MNYEALFERNMGIFEEEEQNRIKNGHVVIVGCGGIGGVIAIALARSGLENFTLIEFDKFSPSNMNRQITCFSDTLGVNKAVTVCESIEKINPNAKVNFIDRALKPDEIDEFIMKGDVFIPAADEWPLSISALNRAKELGIPSIMAYPVGALGRVSVFMSDSPYSAECLAMPYKVGYDGLKAFMENPLNRKILQYYRTEGAWKEDWFNEWCEDRRPHAQLCTIVWITGALAAMEVVKILSGKWNPVVAPRYWHITPDGARIGKFSPGRRLLSRISRRRWGMALLPALAKRPWLVRLVTRAIS